MSYIKLEPLSQAETSLMATLMDEEEQAWLRELDWDYAPIRRILESFLRQRLLPGFVLANDTKILGYCYFLISHLKGVIGTLYASPPYGQQAADSILSRTIESLKAIRNVRRIEAQILPLNGLNPDPIFASHGFENFLRHYLELDLSIREWLEPKPSAAIVPWHSSHLLPAAGVAHRSYRNGIDAIICADYGSEATCAAYLRSLVDNPGCGVFLPGSSFVGLDSRGAPCGFILASRISNTAAMIPQISIHPAHQGKGLGNALIHRALSSLQPAGFQLVRLTVTGQNRRAFEWYLRLGFKIRRNFGAYLWKDD
jgi:ribosomal protein S18 acetylase RimI-like enzyme